MERSEAGAAAELRASLKRLQVEHFDLYQFHSVSTEDELDEITSPGGALDAVLAARDLGLVRYIGITGHGVGAPELFLKALERFDFDSVLFPINFIQYANPGYRERAEELVRVCRARDVGTMIIKSITRGPWGERQKTHNTWYQPFTEMEGIQKGVNFALSLDVTGLCTAGDPQLLPLVLQACENFTPLSLEEQEALIASAGAYEPLFV
jgi:predicted aldo/keto reductase-like oxidoreductase